MFLLCGYSEAYRNYHMVITVYFNLKTFLSHPKTTFNPSLPHILFFDVKIYIFFMLCIQQIIAANGYFGCFLLLIFILELKGFFWFFIVVYIKFQF